MQPNTQQYPIDYLEEISTAPKKSGASNDKLFFIVIIGGLLTAALAGILAFSNFGFNDKESAARLSLRLSNLQTVTESSQKNITSSKLRGINANLSITLVGATSEANGYATASGIDVKKISPSITASESVEELTVLLENARLNSTLDRVYAREMNYQLEALVSLLSYIETNTKSTSFRELASTIRQQIEPIQKQFLNFNTAN